MKINLGNSIGMSKRDIYDAEFFAKYRSIDFSAEGKNREQNLEKLKTLLVEESEQIKTYRKTEDNYMNKSYGKRIAIVFAAAALLCMTTVVYGADLLRIIETVFVGNSRTVVVEDGSMDVSKKERAASLESVAGKVTGSDDAMREPDYVTFKDLDEGLSYFKSDILVPSYLPEGYVFDRVYYYTNSVESLASDPEVEKYVSIIYSNGSDELLSQMRYMDDTTGGETVAEETDVKTFDINGNEAIITGDMLQIAINDVWYMFAAPDGVDVNELSKIAESLQ